MNESQAKVYEVAKNETRYFAGRHLTVPGMKSPNVGRTLNALWRQGKLYRMRTHTNMGWFYSTTPREGFETYSEYQERMKQKSLLYTQNP